MNNEFEKNDELKEIDESTISEDIKVVSPKDYFAKSTQNNEVPINNPEQNSGVNSNKASNQQRSVNNQSLNTIPNSVNSFKNGLKKGQDLSNKVQELRGKNNNRLWGNPSEKTEESSETSGAKEKIDAVKDKLENKVGGKAIQAMSGGVISAKAAEKIAAKAKVLLRKKMKMRAYIAIGVSIGIVIIIVITSIIMSSDDKSLTSMRTNNYAVGDSTDEELIDYMGYIQICPSVAEAKAKAEEKGIELEDDMLTFEIMRELAAYEDIEVSETCMNAMDYYEALKNEYLENKKACYKNRNSSNGTLPNYWIHDDGESAEEAFLNNEKSIAYFIGHKNDYDCQIKIPTELLLETMSYDLTDQDLFNKDYFDRENYVPYSEDLRKLSNALSEYMQETCYKWMYRNLETGALSYDSCENCEKVKVPHDGFYFQISFDKFVCYLKYGDTCNHPNYKDKPRQKYPDLQYLKHLCGSPSSDALQKLQEGNPAKGNCPEQRDNKLAEIFPDGVPTSESEMAPYLATISVPASDVNGNIRNISLTVHKDLAGTFKSIFQELADMKFPIKDAGAYNWRVMASGTGCISYHSFGVAVDINSGANPAAYQKGKPDPSSPYYVNSKVVAVFKKHGFYWGGNWSAKYYDPMHFSYSNH